MASTKFATSDLNNLHFDVLIDRADGITIDDLVRLGMESYDAHSCMEHLMGSYPNIYLRKYSDFSTYSLNTDPRDPHMVIRLKELFKYDKHSLRVLSEASKRFGSINKARASLASTKLSKEEILNKIIGNIISNNNIKTKAKISPQFIQKCSKRYSKDSIIIASFAMGES